MNTEMTHSFDELIEKIGFSIAQKIIDRSLQYCASLGESNANFVPFQFMTNLFVFSL